MPLDLREALVVIPTLNEERHIEACLRSLIDASVLRAGTRVVVADGGSSDATLQIVDRLTGEFPNITVFQNPDRLQTAAVNGAAEAYAQDHHKYLVRCDAHANYPPHYIRDIVAQFHARDVACVATVMDAEGDTCFARAAAWSVDTPLGSGGSGHRGGTASGYVDHGHHAGLRLDWFRRIGGYDKSFAVNEDAEYDHRIGLAGGRIWLASDIRLVYKMRPSLRALWRQYYRYGKGRAATVRKHKMRPRLRQLAPVVNLALLCLSAALMPVSPVFAFWPVLYFGVLSGASIVALSGALGLCGLWAGPALAIMHLSWALGFVAGFYAGRRG